MRVVFTVPEAVEWDARYAEAGPGRLHLNVCGCGRIENFAARMSGSVGCAGKRALNYREAGSKRECGARANHNHQGRKPLGQLGMPRGDGRCVCERTLSRSGVALLKGHL
jgi:hypothetical protein